MRNKLYFLFVSTHVYWSHGSGPAVVEVQQLHLVDNSPCQPQEKVHVFTVYSLQLQKNM